jgi:hypothetical protein
MPSEVNGWREFRSRIRVLRIGKRLPTAVYLHRTALPTVDENLRQHIGGAIAAADPAPEWNIIKLHSDEFAVSFLSYPHFVGLLRAI